MKLIIDISNVDYEFIKDLKSVVIGGRGNTKTIQHNVINAIKYGIPYEERPHGKWIFEEHGYIICSNCGYDCSYNEEGHYIRGSYCYNCGADMRGEDYGS